MVFSNLGENLVPGADAIQLAIQVYLCILSTGHSLVRECIEMHVHNNYFTCYITYYILYTLQNVNHFMILTYTYGLHAGLLLDPDDGCGLALAARTANGRLQHIMGGSVQGEITCPPSAAGPLVLAGNGKVLLAGTGQGEVLAFSWPPPPLGSGQQHDLCKLFPSSSMEAHLPGLCLSSQLRDHL